MQASPDKQQPSSTPESAENANANQSADASLDTAATEPTALGQLAEQMTMADSWLPEYLRPAWTLLQDFPLLRAGLIIIIGIVAAYLVRWLVSNSIGRLTGKTHSTLDLSLIHI